MKSIKARAEAAGVSYLTVLSRRRAGWPESEQFVPAKDMRRSCSHTPAPSHPWKRSAAAKTKRADASLMNLHKRGTK